MGACAEQAAAPDTAADVAAINALREREAAMLNTGNVDSLLTVYATDVHMMPPGEPAQIGHASLRPYIEGMFGAVSLSAKYTSGGVVVAGDWAIDRYTAELTITPKAAGGMPTTEVIKGLHICQRQADGSWKIAYDVWNMDAPPPAPPK
jgi:ketosteroid isomerase-like protein